MSKMTVSEILKQIEFIDGKIKSKSTGITYNVGDFVNTIAAKVQLNKSEKEDLLSHFIDTIKPQSQQSIYVEEIIDKYDFKFSDGVYIVQDKVMTMDEIYRMFWKEEKLLPTDTDSIIENIEKISEPIPLQKQIFDKICEKIVPGKSKYLESLFTLYPNEDWLGIFYNILVPDTKPFFHLFYDDGVGGTGKSTVLEVFTKIVGENFVSNILLDQFGNRFIFSNMLGKYLNVGDDNGKNEELHNVGTLKSIITKNKITIDRKNISPIEVRLFAKQIYATNLFPYIDFTDGGIMRRLNVIQMNNVIPENMKMCEINDTEIGNIIYEVLQYGKDLTQNSNELAITTSPIYRFYDKGSGQTYNDYKSFSYEYGFRQMNIINFEVKSKFVKEFMKRKSKRPATQLQIVTDEEIHKVF